jgi:hypothetical protein
MKGRIHRPQCLLGTFQFLIVTFYPVNIMWKNLLKQFIQRLRIKALKLPSPSAHLPVN